MPADPWSRDLLSVALLTILASVLIPAWDIARINFLHTVAGHMASSVLLPALGFLLALRCGAVDLSVWVCSGVGGVVAGMLIAGGHGVPLACAAGAASGLAIGLANAVLVALVRLPSPIVTFATACVAIWIVGSLVPGRSVEIPEFTFEGWLDWHSSPVLAIRVLAVSFVYLSALLGLLAIDFAVWRGVPFPRWVGLFAALASSGMLSALGGMLWLVDNSQAPLPTRVIDDLRLPAAAILAGGLFLGRQGRELLAGMSLPAALLIATIWRQKVWLLPAPGMGLALQMLVMLSMTIAVHLSFGQYVEARGSDRKLPRASVLLTLGGIVLVAAAAEARSTTTQGLFHAAGIAVWLSGMPALIASMRQEARLNTGLD